MKHLESTGFFIFPSLSYTWSLTSSLTSRLPSIAYILVAFRMLIEAGISVSLLLWMAPSFTGLACRVDDESGCSTLLYAALDRATAWVYHGFFL